MSNSHSFPMRKALMDNILSGRITRETLHDLVEESLSGVRKVVGLYSLDGWGVADPYEATLEVFQVDLVELSRAFFVLDDYASSRHRVRPKKYSDEVYKEYGLDPCIGVLHQSSLSHNLNFYARTGLKDGYSRMPVPILAAPPAPCPLISGSSSETPVQLPLI